MLIGTGKRQRFGAEDCHVGLRPPRNDKECRKGHPAMAGKVHTGTCTQHVIPRTRSVRGNLLLQRCDAGKRRLTLKMYDVNRYGKGQHMGAGDCHVGLRPPRNDKERQTWPMKTLSPLRKPRRGENKKPGASPQTKAAPRGSQQAGANRPVKNPLPGLWGYAERQEFRKGENKNYEEK